MAGELLPPPASVEQMDAAEAVDLVLPVLMVHAVTSVVTELASDADVRGDRSALGEMAVRAALAREERWLAAARVQVRRKYAELRGMLPGLPARCPVRLVGFGPARTDEQQKLEPDDLEVHYRALGTDGVFYVNHKLDKPGGGLSRIAAGTSFFAAATGANIASRDAAIATTVADASAAGHVQSSAVVVICAHDQPSPERPTTVLGYDPLAVLAYHEGDFNPEAGVDPSEWVCTVVPRTANVHLTEAWLVQQHHRRATELWKRLGPALVASRTATATTAAVALRRYSTMINVAVEEERRRARSMDRVARAEYSSRAGQCDAAVAAVANALAAPEMVA